MTQLNFDAVISDVDNTLLIGSDLSTANQDAVKKLIDAGYVFVLATGRQLHHVIDLYNCLGLTTPIVSSDGASVDYPGGKCISEQPLFRNASEHIIEEAMKRQITCLCFHAEGVTVTSKHDWSVNMQRHDELGWRFKHGTLRSMKNTAVLKPLLYAQDSTRLDDLQEHMMQLYDDVVDCIRYPNTLEFVAKGVSKVSALQVVAQHCGFQLSQSICFGDGNNDVGMFKSVRHAVCMHHGTAAAKAAAHQIAPKTDPGINFAAAVDQLLKSPPK